MQHYVSHPNTHTHARMHIMHTRTSVSLCLNKIHECLGLMRLILSLEADKRLALCERITQTGHMNVTVT
jgi:hypothetical protein